MGCCEICGKGPLPNPRAKTCSVKCRTIKHRRSKKLDTIVLSGDEKRFLDWFNLALPVAGKALSILLVEYGKEAFLLAYTAMNEYARFCEEELQKGIEVQKAS